MSNIDDHGLEVIKKSAEYTEPLSPTKKKDYYLKVGGAPSGSSYTIPPIPIFITDTNNRSDVNEFNSISSVPSSTETLITSYTVPLIKVFYLSRIEVSGENISKYNVYFNGVLNASKRTWFNGNMSECFEFINKDNFGHKFTAGDQIEVKVIHSRPMLADYDCRIQGVLED